MVTSSTPRPMPTTPRHKITPSALCCRPIATVATQYQSSAKENTARRPKRSTSGLSRLAPRNRPRNVAEANAAWSAMPNTPAAPSAKMPSRSRPGLR
ncbi:hypothetical protein NB713_003453 [Xanthomonas sacchari]|nr:hypothetical protein [Xanthomonas sacchari]